MHARSVTETVQSAKSTHSVFGRERYRVRPCKRRAANPRRTLSEPFSLALVAGSAGHSRSVWSAPSFHDQRS
jgi:hypothetical protein